MLLTRSNHLNVLKVVLAATFTSAIAMIWLACAIMGFVAIQQSHRCHVVQPKTLPKNLE